MIVRLDLHADVLPVVELDDTGVVLKHADAPIFASEPPPDFNRRGEDRFLEQVFERDLALFVAIAHPAAKRLVRTVFAPSLCNRLELGVGRVVSPVGEMLPDRLHFREAQVKLPPAAELEELLIGHAADRHGHGSKRVFRTVRQVRQLQRPPDDLLDGVIGEHFAGDAFEIGGRSAGSKRVFLAGPYRGDRISQVDERGFHAVGDVVGDSRFIENIEE